LFAQEETPPPVDVTHITGNLHKLYFNDQTAVIASIGEDGLLLVDTAYAFTTDAAQEVLDKLRAGPAKLIINTHGDADHVGGNDALGGSARIIAHPTVRTAMSTYYSLPAIDAGGLPDITVIDETTIHFNSEKIKVIPIPGGHTRGDLLVHFSDSKVLCLGDIVLSGAFPNADPGRGGDAKRLLQVLKKLHAEMPTSTGTLTISMPCIRSSRRMPAIPHITSARAVDGKVADSHEAGRVITTNTSHRSRTWKLTSIRLATPVLQSVVSGNDESHLSAFINVSSWPTPAGRTVENHACGIAAYCSTGPSRQAIAY